MPPQMSLPSRWWFALKPNSWPKLMVPTLLGQSLGLAAARGLELAAVVVGLVYTLGLIVFIVLLNDWGDREVDAIKRRMFPDGCSPKTIPDGVLPARAVLFGGVAGGGIALGATAVGQLWLGRPDLTLYAVGSIAIFMAYTFPPLKLNYRGGGELLEAFGVGAALPWTQAYLQGVQTWHPTYSLLIGFTLLSMASALASGLSDEESDRAGGKRTFATLLGNVTTRRCTEVCVALGAATWMVTGLATRAVAWWSAVPAAAVVLYHLVMLRAASGRAVTNAFAAQGIYKRLLHRAIWHGGAALALLLALSVSW